MKINLNAPGEFTIEKLKQLIASEDDSVNTQFRVTDEGILFLSKIVGNRELDGIRFRFETNGMLNGYVGKKASENEIWVKRIFDAVNENWPNPYSTYIDNF